MMINKKVAFLIAIAVVLTVSGGGCTRGVTNTVSTSHKTSIATTTSKVTATPSPSGVPRPKAKAVPTATPSKTPIAYAAACNFIGDSSTHILYSAWCPCVSKVKPEHRVCFDTAQHAIAAGYRA